MTRAPDLPSSFDALTEDFFSLGQTENYYETLNQLDEHLRVRVLDGLRDVAYNLTHFQKAANELVMTESLLRDIPVTNVENRFHRLANGDARLTAFKFQYLFPTPSLPNVAPPPPLSFIVEPKSEPPTNVHVLIGRNGVGKTRCMQGIATALLTQDDNDVNTGRLQPLGNNHSDWAFSGLVHVSFSAFDDFDMPSVGQSRVKAHSVGLRVTDEETKQVRIKTPDDLAEDFKSALEFCRSGLRAQRWRKALSTLSSDPVFSDADVISLLDENQDWVAAAKSLFGKLSSGHKIVLLTITKLVELVDERTLVLLDEPEGHLHPPLLSAFIRSVSDLLVQRNGVAIVATHSPVVLQEVPRSCAWVLRRSGHATSVERPAIETFGENVGALTREVFGLEVTDAGFHKLIRDAVEQEGLNYEEVIKHFNEQLGAEGRAIARGLVALRKAQ